MKKNIYKLFLLVAVLSLFLYLLFNKQAYVFSGYSMGTTYKVVMYDQFIHPNKFKKIKVAVEDELLRLNKIFSTFDENSEVSRFNHFLVDEYFIPSDDLLKVMIIAKEVSALTNGAYDFTVDPLVRLWGFGKDVRYAFPLKKEVDDILLNIGYENIIITNNSFIKKKDVTVDLASIAKGYAVDVVTEIIKSFQQYNFLVEIGGELYVSGDESYKMGWDVYVVDPRDVDKSIVTLKLKNKGIATSGGYRNYRIHNGEKYQHIINPHNGHPVFNSLASVTIIADKTVFADALATGILVMGAEQGLELINSISGVEAVLVENIDQGIKVIKSEGI